MLEINTSDVLSSLIIIWILWVTGACTVVTYGANKQHKTNNAAFSKIREIEKKLKGEEK